MSVTGTLLAFQQSVLKMVERPQRFVEVPAGAARLDVDALLERVRAGVPDAEPTTLTLDSDPRVDGGGSRSGSAARCSSIPTRARCSGSGRARARAFYRSVTSWHRYLSVEGENRATARAITGACNAAFLVLAITGLISVVAATVDVAARDAGDLLPLGAARQGARLQLAQRHRILVRAGAHRAHRDGHGHLVHAGRATSSTR